MKELLETFQPIKDSIQSTINNYKSSKNKGLTVGYQKELSTFYASLTSLTGQIEAFYIRAETERKTKYHECYVSLIKSESSTKAKELAEYEVRDLKTTESECHAEFKELKWLCEGVEKVLNAMARDLKYEENERY